MPVVDAVRARSAAARNGEGFAMHVLVVVLTVPVTVMISTLLLERLERWIGGTP